MERCAKSNVGNETYKDFFKGKTRRINVRFINSTESELFKETINADHTLLGKTFIYESDIFPDIIEIYVDNVARYVYRDYRFLGVDFKRSSYLVTILYGLIHEIFHEFQNDKRLLELIFEGKVLV